MTLGQRIRERRIELGLSQAELGKKLGGLSRAAVCSVEKDKEDLTLERVRKYAEALECEPGYLAGWLSSPNSKATEMYDKYANSDPEIQIAIDHLLKSKR